MAEATRDTEKHGTWLDHIGGMSRASCKCGWTGEFTTNSTTAAREASRHEDGVTPDTGGTK